MIPMYEAAINLHRRSEGGERYGSVGAVSPLEVSVPSYTTIVSTVVWELSWQTVSKNHAFSVIKT